METQNVYCRHCQTATDRIDNYCVQCGLNPVGKSKMSIEHITNRIQEIKAELKSLEAEQVALKEKERQELWKSLSEQYGVELHEGQEFIVTEAIRQFIIERGFGEVRVRTWDVGQRAEIVSWNGYKGFEIRTICYTGHMVNVGSSYQVIMQELKSLDTPLPIELVVEALK